MNIEELAGKTVKAAHMPYSDTTENEYAIEFTDGTIISFSPDAYSPHLVTS